MLLLVSFLVTRENLMDFEWQRLTSTYSELYWSDTTTNVRPSKRKSQNSKDNLVGAHRRLQLPQMEPPANASHYRQSPTSASQPHRKIDGLLSTQSRN